MNLAALLFDVARRLPEQPAVSDERHSWNYREFAQRVARLAGGLQGRGLVPGDRVLLALENCGEFFELLFGCWAAGLCAVPANARLHPREVEYIAADSGARLLVATPGLAEALAPLAGSVDSLDEVIATRTPRYDALFAAEPVRPEPGASTDRAWLFYTSGTTGRPKGAVLTHRNLLYRFGLIDSSHRDSLPRYQMWGLGDERREDVGTALGCGDGAGGVSGRA